MQIRRLYFGIAILASLAAAPAGMAFHVGANALAHSASLVVSSAPVSSEATAAAEAAAAADEASGAAADEAFVAAADDATASDADEAIAADDDEAIAADDDDASATADDDASATADELSGTGDRLSLILPTSNDALLRGDGPSYYQYTDRRFNGVRSRPWQGGQYGFVRNPKHTSSGIVYTRFHEGMDIKPVYRDRQGEPLDTVRAIDDGYVVHVNTVEHYSSYGKYVVVEHWWSGSPFYSLYAHLGEVNVRKGDRVFQADRLGRIGYTGRGINLRRAHLHFEINMLLNEGFNEWYSDAYRSRNRHGVHNGINMAGLNVAELYESLYRDSALTIEQFITRQEVAYTIAVPNDGVLDLTFRYDWLETPRAQNAAVGSWEVSFTASGLPVRVQASPRSITSPTVARVERATVPYGYITKGIVAGSRDSYYLSKSGKRYASLLTHFARERPIADTETPTVLEVSESASERLRSW